MTLVADPAPAPSEARRTPYHTGRDDLIRVPGGRWGLWPVACLRAAGFPAANVLALSSPLSARLAERQIESRTPAARASLRDTYGAERLRIRAALRDLARDPRFREAVTWQNRSAARYAVAKLAAAPVEHLDNKMREKELLVASYAQRYSVKNDTIGFFGPVGWARFSDAGFAAAVECGPGLLASREVYFESWCIDEVARALDRWPELRPWQIPRVPPYVRLEGARVMMASRVVLELQRDHAKLFAACDGSRHAKAIARVLRSSCASSFPSDEAVYETLEQWRRAGYLTWTFEGPRELHPERTLARRLAAIDDPALRERALTDFSEIDAARQSIRSAAGDAEALDGALGALESAFSRITGTAATRSEGQMYAARTLVYEECRRDITVALGGEVVRRLGPPLSLLLQSARWAVHELARRHATVFRRAYDQLSRPGGREVTLGSFFARTALVGDTRGALSPIAADVQAALQQRWAEVLRAPAAAHRIQFRSRDLRAAVDAAFDTGSEPPSAWARYISPDVMIDAPGVEAVRRGEYQLVIGEVHVLNSVAQSAFMTQCPDAEGVIRALDRDNPEPRVFWLAPKDAATQRVQYTRKPNDFVYVTSRDPSPDAPARTLAVADLIVVDEAGSLFVQTRDGRLRFGCDEFFGYLMMRKEVNLFAPLAPAAHRPRVTIDEVVISREQWQLPASDLAFARQGDAADRFVECRRWANGRGIPQFVFVKVPTERKPIYVDLESPLFVDLLARAIRILQRTDPASLVTITEMLPTPSGAWLVDADGRRYTSELRMVAVDPFVWKIAGSSALPAS